ncbi:MAG: hypothetical protein ACYDH9_20385 [Limisphaerales bacterium]
MKKPISFLAAGILITALTLLVWLLVPAPRRLSAVATRLEQIDQWARTWDQFPEPYAWCSTNEILALRALNQGDFQLERVHVRTGTTQPLHGLDAFFSNHENRSEGFVWKTSPDGQWFFGLTHGLTNGITLLACRLDGTSASKWSSTADGLEIFPDGSGWVELVERPTQTIARVISRETHAAREIALRTAHGVVPIGLAQGGASLVCWEIPTETQSISPMICCQFDLNRPQLRPKLFSIDVGRLACSMDQAEMSPQGDRIAWLFGFHNRETVVGYLKRRLRRRPPAWYKTIGLWICHADGTGLHEIARADATEPVSDLRWLLDGKHVSVIYRDGLWTVPVD